MKRHRRAAVKSKILVIRPGALGDTILALPLIQSIQGQFPAARITFMGRRAYRELLPDHIAFLPFDDPAAGRLFQEGLAPERTEGWDRAYVALNRPETVIRNLAGAGTGEIVHVRSDPPPGVHVVEHLHRGLGLPVPPRRPALIDRAPRRRETILWVHPGSGGPRKCLPLETLLLAVKRLRELLAARVVVTMGEEDGFLKERPLWFRLVGETAAEVRENEQLSVLCRDLGGSTMFLGNDCGISHLAAALNVPATVVFIASDPAVWAPWTGPERLRIVNMRGRSAQDAVCEVRAAVERAAGELVAPAE